MKHTRECRDVMVFADFSEEDYRYIELWLTRHTAKQIISLVRSKDPKGEKDASWFEPFFGTYVPVLRNYDFFVGENFWEAYDCLADFVDDDFYVSDLQYISEMGDDLPRMRHAIEKSKPNIRYVYKVFHSLYIPKKQYNQVPEEIQRKDVRTSDEFN